MSQDLESLDRLRSHLEGRVRQLARDKAELAQGNEVLRRSRAQLRQDVSQLEQDLQRLIDRASAEQAALARTQAANRREGEVFLLLEAAAAETVALGRERDALRAEKAALGDQLAELQGGLREMGEAVAAAEAKVASRRKEAAVAKQQLAGYQAELALVRRELWAAVMDLQRGAALSRVFRMGAVADSARLASLIEVGSLPSFSCFGVGCKRKLEIYLPMSITVVPAAAVGPGEGRREQRRGPRPRRESGEGACHGQGCHTRGCRPLPEAAAGGRCARPQGAATRPARQGQGCPDLGDPRQACRVRAGGLAGCPDT